MNAITDLGLFAWEALWLPVFVWTCCMGLMLGALKLVPSKWIQVHLDIRLAGLLALVVGVLASWIFPLTPETTAAFISVSNPLQSVASSVPSTPELVESVPTLTTFTAIGAFTALAIVISVLGIFQLIVGGFKLSQLLKRSGKAQNMELLTKGVEVVVSADTQVAFSAGILRRRIVLPAFVAPEDLPAVLAHELSHHTNGDIVRSWLSHSVRALFFFHPLVHLLHSESLLLTEIACDRRTLEGARLEPRAYADLLVRSTPQSNRNAPVLALAHSPSQLRKRITAMKNTILLPFSGSQLTLFGAIFVFLLGGIVGCTEFQTGPTEADVALEGYDLIMELPEAPAGKTNDPFVVVEQAPTLIGGLVGLQNTLKYPEIAKKAGVQGRVFLQFVVQPDGRVTDAVVTRGIGAGCDEAALEMVRNAKFIPGVQDGMRVPVKMSLPVTFKLDESGEPILDGEKLKAATAPPPSKYPPVPLADVRVLETLKDVDFEYDIIMMGPLVEGNPDAFKNLAAQRGADHVIGASPENSALLAAKGIAGKGMDTSNIVIAIRRKQ